MELIEVHSSRIPAFEPNPAAMAVGPQVREARDGRGVNVRWQAAAVAEGEGPVDAVALTVYWDGDAKRFRATVQRVTIENYHGMTIETNPNLVMNPRSSVVSEPFARFNRAKLAEFADDAQAWVMAGCAFVSPVRY